MRSSRYTSFLLASLLTAFPAMAQIGTSTMTGRVTDATGAVVPGATVTVVQPSTNFTFNTTTNEDGLYRVLSLNSGMYRVSVEASGFQEVRARRCRTPYRGHAGG